MLYITSALTREFWKVSGSASKRHYRMATPRLSLETRVKLRDGNDIPQLGFGVYELNRDETYRCVTIALREGYRHIDSAKWYENEKECGQAIRDFCARTNTPREQIFFTTKLKENKGLTATKKAIESSLRECELGYIDLYLVHSPIGGPRRRLESWNAILEAQTEGKIKSVGVSNYGVSHIQEMVDSGLPLPVINQIDLHPFMSREEIVAICHKHQIALEAWAPLARGMRFSHPVVQELAKKYSKEPAQILLRYSLQKGYIPLPKSGTANRIASNKDIYDFELSDEEVKELYLLHEYLVTDWDVVDVA